MKRIIFAIGMSIMLFSCGNSISKQTEALMIKGDSLLDKRDSIGAYKCYKEVADKGYAVGKYKEAVCHLDGIGVEKDSAIAQKIFNETFKLLMKDSKNIRAWRYLGDCYYNGDGVEKNYTQAVKWYSKATEKGDAISQLFLGDCYRLGKGIEKNYIAAAEWYRKAAEQGNNDAQSNLGLCYIIGDGVKKIIQKL
ncbi:MAG: sel1 repeat family protein [Paludibacteraceae bacterium]|nr:sel1 repeat family protein [Paludibacteraceae bacterium]